jgi:hypothetical protein
MFTARIITITRVRKSRLDFIMLGKTVKIVNFVRAGL